MLALYYLAYSLGALFVLAAIGALLSGSFKDAAAGAVLAGVLNYVATNIDPRGHDPMSAESTVQVDDMRSEGPHLEPDRSSKGSNSQDVNTFVAGPVEIAAAKDRRRRSAVEAELRRKKDLEDAETREKEKRANQKVAEAQAAERRELECQVDIECWAGRHRLEGTRACREAIGLLVKNEYRWTDGLIGTKFPRHMWPERSDEQRSRSYQKQTVVFAGDKIQIKNGSGVWQDYSYFCDFDPESKEVRRVRFEPGRLPS